MPTNEVKLLLSVSHDRPSETVDLWRRWCIYRAKPIPSFCFSPGSLPLCTFPCTILRTLDRTSITVFHRDTTKPTFYFGSRISDREECRTKSHASSTTRSSSEQSEVARLIEYQRTINTFQGNVDTLAQIPQYIVTTSRLTEIGRSDVKVSQVDPALCRFRRGYKTVRQRRTRYGRFSGLVD